MGNIKKKLDGEWKVIGSNRATGIGTVNPALLEEGESIASVDKVLERQKGTLDKLERNVAWLALHGGGGSGGSGGGGSTITEATCTLLVNDLGSGNSVKLDDSGLILTLSGINAKVKKDWQVTVTLNGLSLLQTTASYTRPNITISLKRILDSKALSNHVGTLRVYASYEDELNGVYSDNVLGSWTISESTISIVPNSPTIAVDALNQENSTINYTFSVGIAGVYNLQIISLKNNGTPYSYSSTITLSNNALSVQYPLKTILGLTDSQSAAQKAGVYNLTTVLTNSNDSTVTESVTHTAKVVSENILISSSNMSDDGSNPVEISLGGNINVTWTADVEGGGSFKYSYRVSCNGQTYNIGDNGSGGPKENPGYFGVEVKDLISLVGDDKPWVAENNELGLVLRVWIGDKEATVTYYIRLVAAASTYLPLSDAGRNTAITQFFANNYNNGTSTFNTGANSYTSNLSTLNGNSLSVISSLTSGLQFLRLSNGAIAKMTNWKYGAQGATLTNLRDVLTSGSYTISLVFKADYHPDDDRTVFCCGTVDVNTGELISGISIDVHDIYINGNSVVKLTDNTINFVDITLENNMVETLDALMQAHSVASFIVKIYLDGVMTTVLQLESPLALNSPIYLGGKYYTNPDTVYSHLCDCNIYSLQIFNSALSELDLAINYINNKVRTDYIGGVPHWGIIPEELSKNGCFLTELGTVDSNIYDSASRRFTADTLISADGSLDVRMFNNHSVNFDIPVMFIDVSSTTWTFDKFTDDASRNQIALPAALNVKIQYWDPHGTTDLVITMSGVTVELQGTSTLQDYVKNINITVPDETAFIPKSTWFPEQTYTLKADIVDSSHSCNAAIGKFINDVLGYQESNGQSFLPFADEAKDNVYHKSGDNYTEYKSQLPDVTLKHTIEGFPVFLIVKFATENIGDITSTPLGIYSFNLGRNAYRNLGMKKLHRIVDSVTNEEIEANNITFPYVNLSVRFDEDSDAENKALWIEAKTNPDNIAGFSDMEDNVNISTLNTSGGDFWQNDSTILNYRYEVRFPDNKNVTQYQVFSDMVGNIMTLPVEGLYASTGAFNSGQTVVDNIKPLFDDESAGYTLYEYVLLEGVYSYIPKEGKQMFTTIANDLTDNLGLNLESAYKYFVTALLFGLVDNFSKNVTYRCWRSNANANWGDFYVDFYDLDTALGGDNQGNLNVYPDLWIKYLRNKPVAGKNYGYVIETLNESLGASRSSMNSNFNKIWMSLDTPTIKRKGYSGVVDSLSVYSTYWYMLRAKLDEVSSANGYNNFVDYFINEYFITQTGSCGPLLFNYDYKLKYLMQFKDNSPILGKSLPKLHGRKIDYVRDWLKKHILFLDSLFYWRDRLSDFANVANNVQNIGSTGVKATPEDFPITTNTPLIVQSSVDTDMNDAFYFMLKNVKTYINAGNQSNQLTNWQISNSSNIIEFGDSGRTLREMNIATMSYMPNAHPFDYLGFPAVTELNFAGATAFEAFNLDAFKQGNLSELRVLDFRNTSGRGDLELALKSEVLGGGSITKFTKLQKIDISGSTFITKLVLPDIPLKELNITNSAITEFILKDLKYLSNVDLTGCNRLTKVQINNCESYTEVVLNNLANLTEVEISHCANLERIKISNCNNLSRISISNNDSLKVIDINTCPSLVYSVADNYGLSILSCHTLQVFKLENCSRLTTFVITDSNLENITHFILRNTGVSYITGDNAVTTYTDTNNYTTTATSILDLSKFKKLNIQGGDNNVTVLGTSYSPSFICLSNPNIIKLRLYVSATSIDNTFIPITSTFEGCNNLERIYGNVDIRCTSCFARLPKFSIHGANATTYRALDISGAITPMPTFTEDSNTNRPIITIRANQVGDTNMKFTGSGNSLQYTFLGAAYTIFDVYYFLCYIGSNVTSLYLAFGEGKNTDKGRFTFSNSPNANMFKYCSNVTNFGGLFYGVSNVVKLKSPTYSSGQFANDGIYSSIGNENSAVNLSMMWGQGSSIYFDRHLFRTNGATKKINNIDYLWGNIILPVGFSGTAVPSAEDMATHLASSLGVSEENSYGSLKDFFANFDKTVTLSIKGFCGENTYNADTDVNNQGGTLFINYRVFGDLPSVVSSTNRFPSNIIDLQGVFVAKYSIGDLVLNNLFDAPQNIKNIYQSFVTTRDLSTVTNLVAPYITKFAITDGILDSFTNLEKISYTTSGFARTTSANGAPFSGAGIIKQIEQDSFPFNIIKKNHKLVEFVGFFLNCKVADGYSIENLQLPGDLFNNLANDISGTASLQKTKITSVELLFYNINIPYTLTGESFAKCPELLNVNRLFGAKTMSKVSGEIPLRLFFHGYSTTNRTISFSGWNPANAELDTLEYAAANATATTTSITGVNIPNKNITKATGIFEACKHLSPYTQSSPTSEKNEEYSPYKYILENEVWKVNPNYNPFENTYKWTYDGVNVPVAAQNEILTIEDGAISFGGRTVVYSSESGGTVSYDHSATQASGVTIPSTHYNDDSYATSLASMNFICPPDLLRYCANTSTLTINRLFYNCGVSGWNPTWNTEYVEGSTTNRVEAFQYGIYGRICPWLLKPVSSVTDISGMFTNCKRISNYNLGDSSYVIPSDFFYYAKNINNLSYTFYGMAFPASINLNVFSPITTVTSKNLSFVFNSSYFAGTSEQRTTINGIFNTFLLTSVRGAFAVLDTSISSISNITGQYVTFSNIFKTGYNKADEYASDSRVANFSYAFAGYNVNTVIHESTKTLVDTDATKNYYTVG